MGALYYTKPEFSRKVDSELHLLPPAAPCQTRSGHHWCFWAWWSTVVSKTFIL